MQELLERFTNGYEAWALGGRESQHQNLWRSLYILSDSLFGGEGTDRVVSKHQGRFTVVINVTILLG